MNPTNPTIPVNVQQAFNVAYVASLPTPVQALFTFEYIGNPGVLTLVSNMPFPQYLAQFQSLIARGYGAFLLSVGIGGDPYSVFSTLSAIGETWVPNATQIPLGLPGQYSGPGQSLIYPGYSLGPYPTTKPAGWITVPPMAQLLAPGANVSALLGAWYPPFNLPAPPPPPAPPAPTDPVGAQMTGTSDYYDAPGANETTYPNGAEYTDSRGTFIHSLVATPFGTVSYWTLLAAAFPGFMITLPVTTDANDSLAALVSINGGTLAKLAVIQTNAQAYNASGVNVTATLTAAGVSVPALLTAMQALYAAPS